MNENEYVLLIQGPIHSDGVSYLDSNKVIKFNAESTILDNVLKAKSIFKFVVLSTYFNEITKDFRSKLNSLGVILVDNKLLKKEEISHIKLNRKNSSRLQINTTLNGLNVIKSLVTNDPFVLKIRTDTSINFEFIKENLEYEKFYFLYATLINGDSFFYEILKKLGLMDFHLPDFYIAAKCTNFIKLFDQMFNNSMASGIHQDLIISLLYLNNKPYLRLKLIESSMYNPRFAKVKSHLYNWMSYYNMFFFMCYHKKMISLMGKSVSDSSLWRGTSYLLEEWDQSNRIYVIK